MYNSNLKYYTKALIGRKNEMWYFDNWVKKYYRNNKKFITEYKKLGNISIGSSPKLNLYDDYYKEIFLLREDSMNFHKDYFINEKICIAIHFPPLNISPGANSWFNNIKVALEFMGVQVYAFWDSVDPIKLGTAKIILGIGAKISEDVIDWNIIDTVASTHNIPIILQASVNVTNLLEINQFINFYKAKCITHFFSFDFDTFNLESGVKQFFRDNGAILYSIPFSANPVIHYPVQFENQNMDYIFIGSTNYDKINRYNDYFSKLTENEFNGLIIGSGWPWSEDFQYDYIRDRALYSKAKVALNLHLDFQVNISGQINERAYILSALCIPQITDRVINIETNFENIGLIANNPNDYLENIYTLLNNPEYAKELVLESYKVLYTKHTTFHRMVQFFSEAGITTNTTTQN